MKWVLILLVASMPLTASAQFSAETNVYVTYSRFAKGNNKNMFDSIYRFETRYKPSTGLMFVFEPEFRLSGPHSVKDAVMYENTYGDPASVMMRQYYIDLTHQHSRYRLGKMEFYQHTPLNFVDFSPYTSRSLLEPFRGLEDKNRQANIGVSAETFVSEKIMLYGAMVRKNLPGIATYSDNPWTQKLPSPFTYGDPIVGNTYGYGGGLYWEGAIAGDIGYYHGSSNVPDHTTIQGTEVSMVFPKQHNLTATLVSVLKGWTIKTAGSYYKQHQADEFITLLVEVERTREHFLLPHDNIFISVGYADVATRTTSATSQPEVDFRRLYQGGTVLGTIEYEATPGLVFKFRVAYNVGQQGRYSYLSCSQNIGKYATITLGGELIDAQTPGSLFYTYRNNDRGFANVHFHIY